MIQRVNSNTDISKQDCSWCFEAIEADFENSCRIVPLDVLSSSEACVKKLHTATWQVIKLCGWFMAGGLSSEALDIALLLCSSQRWKCMRLLISQVHQELCQYQEPSIGDEI